MYYAVSMILNLIVPFLDEGGEKKENEKEEKRGGGEGVGVLFL